VVKAEIKKFGRSYRQLLALLVIHGMLHLKGMRHGAKMDRLEEEYDQKYFSRH
jgi:ssRNA-specific RNase YbeY (16S rRNA maturation enzyme)